MRIAFLTAELAPHAHVGGLGDVARGLPGALASAGEEVLVLVPGHGGLIPRGDHLGALDLGPMGEVAVERVATSPETWAVRSERWFGSDRIYGAPDDHLRFGAFTAGALAAALEWGPDVVHLNDWHTALGALHLEALDAAVTPTVLTIHNLAFQGVVGAGDLAAIGLERQAGRVIPGGSEVNSLATGIATATLVTTVSPTYAREITTPERGEGLHTLLADRGRDLIGILNGIGPEWDPATDPHLPEPFTPIDLAGKAAARRAVLDAFGFDDAAVPVIGVVSRLTPQKGLDLVPGALEPWLAAGEVRLVVVGVGDADIEEGFRRLVARFPAAAGFADRFDPPLAHLVVGGSDLLLMPSRFEPCGLNQMYAMRYGTIPVVHRTGGLADTVSEWDPSSGAGTGFVFDDHSTGGLRAAVGRALDAVGEPGRRAALVANGMARDDSWVSRVPAFLDAYRRAAR